MNAVQPTNETEGTSNGSDAQTGHRKGHRWVLPRRLTFDCRGELSDGCLHSKQAHLFFSTSVWNLLSQQKEEQKSFPFVGFVWKGKDRLTGNFDTIDTSWSSQSLWHEACTFTITWLVKDFLTSLKFTLVHAFIISSPIIEFSEKIFVFFPITFKVFPSNYRTESIIYTQLFHFDFPFHI